MAKQRLIHPSCCFASFPSCSLWISGTWVGDWSDSGTHSEVSSPWVPLSSPYASSAVLSKWRPLQEHGLSHSSHTDNVHWVPHVAKLEPCHSGAFAGVVQPGFSTAHSFPDLTIGGLWRWNVDCPAVVEVCGISILFNWISTWPENSLPPHLFLLQSKATFWVDSSLWSKCISLCVIPLGEAIF